MKGDHINMNEKRKASAADKLINVIIAVVLVAFVAVGVYATYGKLSQGIKDRKIASGEAEPTVDYLARQASMSVEDYLAQYGLTLSDTVTKNTPESEMTDNMTIENYLKYSGMEQTADQVISDAGLTDTVTKDTLWKDFFPQLPVSMVYDQSTFEQLKTQLGLGDEVTLDMKYGDFEKILDEKTATAGESPAPTEEAAEPTDNAEASESEQTPQGE